MAVAKADTEDLAEANVEGEAVAGLRLRLWLRMWLYSRCGCG